VIGALLLLLAGARCTSVPPAQRAPAPTTLRVGASQLLLNQFIENLTLEGLTKISLNGQVKAWLAEDVKTSSDGLLITITTRPNVRFHDGSAVTSEIIATTLREAFTQTRSPFTAADIQAIVAAADNRIEIRLRRPSRFVFESLEELIRKPGAREIGTGPFAVVDSEGTDAEVRANPDYYHGAPTLNRIVVNMYPTIRAAWAEILRDNLDMVYEVGVNALDSLEMSDRIDVYSFPRSYQYVMFFDTRAPALRSPEVRRALNLAINRSAFVRDALNRRGLESSGPVWPRNWAVEGELKQLPFDPAAASRILSNSGRRLAFHCLVGPDDELAGLVLKRQLAEVGVDLILEEASIDRLKDPREWGNFEAILMTAISGPNLLRTALWWHSKSSRNSGWYASTRVDSAIDDARAALTDEAYRRAVLEFQHAVMEDPPALFLAWNERARAVSSRFKVPVLEPNTDILGTLPQWTLADPSDRSPAN
jgi:peptide/nickel transport system substrate-binding protein